MSFIHRRYKYPIAPTGRWYINGFNELHIEVKRGFFKREWVFEGDVLEVNNCHE